MSRPGRIGPITTRVINAKDLEALDLEYKLTGGWVVRCVLYLPRSWRRVLFFSDRWFSRPLQTALAKTVGNIQMARIQSIAGPLNRPALEKLIRFARRSAPEQLQIVRRKVSQRLQKRDWYWRFRRPGKDKTTYIIGLFGTGRMYISDVLRKHMPDRARYYSERIRFHHGPTSMIYSGHATTKYLSRGQWPPSAMSQILEEVSSGKAILIFIYRHPLDSLLTNWVWWRNYIRDKIMVQGISQVYKSTAELCADLESHFSEFMSFAEGDPGFFAAIPGAPFLSFKQFVEETELHMPLATLTLRLEDFMIDPTREFSKIVAVMGADVHTNGLQVAPPRTKPFGYLAVKATVPKFKHFVENLDTETKRRIAKIGYAPDI